jgi:hypothetical protein
MTYGRFAAKAKSYRNGRSKRRLWKDSTLFEAVRFEVELFDETVKLAMVYLQEPRSGHLLSPRFFKRPHDEFAVNIIKSRKRFFILCIRQNI